MDTIKPNIKNKIYKNFVSYLCINYRMFKVHNLKIDFLT